MADPLPPGDPPPPDAQSSTSTTSISRRRAPPPLLAPRLLAPRSIFFTIPLRSALHESSPIAPVQVLTGAYLSAIDRVNNAPARDGTRPGLDGDQRSGLIALLTILNDYHAAHPLTIALTAEVAANTDVLALAAYGNVIHRGLAAFQSKHRAPSAAGSSTLVDSAASRRSPYSAANRRRGGSSRSHPSNSRHSASSTSRSTPSDTPPAAPASSSRASRSPSIRTTCRQRDLSRCRICAGPRVLSAHILPFSLRGPRSRDFWALIALFRGRAPTLQLQRHALQPDATSADNILNVVCLCPNCHDLFDSGAVSLIPDLQGVVFPYSPWTQDAYDVLVEFPAGPVRVLAETEDGVLFRVAPGYRVRWTTDAPEQRPLPHPLLLQVHAVCTRVVRMRAAAGWTGEDAGSEGRTEWEDVDVLVEGGEGGAGEGGAGGGEGGEVDEEKPREWRPDVVAAELKVRETERGMLWAKKMRGMDVADVAEVEFAA